MNLIARYLRLIANRIDPPRGRPTADRGDELDMDFDDPTSWGERPV